MFARDPRQLLGRAGVERVLLVAQVVRALRLRVRQVGELVSVSGIERERENVYNRWRKMPVIVCVCVCVCV